MKNYKMTNRSCILSITVQAVITNIIAVLYIPLKHLYGLSYTDFGILIGINFVTQFLADVSFSGIIDKVGYKKIVMPTCIVSFIGLTLLAVSPFIFTKNVFIGLIIATVIFAFSSGLLEILLSPIVASIAVENKGQAMSSMHSFYAWGQVMAIAVTTLFLYIFGIKYWQIIVGVWALLPLINFFMYKKSLFPPLVEKEIREGAKKILFKPFYIICLLAIFFGGASEIIMNQWSSTFLENALKLPKVTGDLIGMCGFSIMLGLGRSLHGKFGNRFNLNTLMLVTSVLAFVCYVTVGISPSNIVCVIACIICGFGVSILWPGTIVIASEKYPLAGAWLFAILAMFGDFSGAVTPTITGLIVDNGINYPIVHTISNWLNISIEQGSLRFGILVSAIYPLCCFVCHLILDKINKKDKKLELQLNNNSNN